MASKLKKRGSKAAAPGAGDPMKLPPMYARVDVSSELGTAARRERVLATVALLAESQVVTELAIYVRCEQGAVIRLGKTLPAEVKAAAEFAGRVFCQLEEVVSNAAIWSLVRDDSLDAGPSFEGLSMAQLQGLMDLVFEAQARFGQTARIAVAGVGTFDPVVLRRFRATSAFESGVNLAGEVRRLVRGVGERPFFGLLKVSGAKRRKRPQTGRSRPASPGETEPDDVALLRAIAAEDPDRDLATLARGFGIRKSSGHFSKRRMDLTKWGWITGGRDPRLTDAGRRWLSEIESADPR